MCSTILTIALTIVSMAAPVIAQTADDTCEIDGQIFQRGENLGSSFVTRCGPASDYPCFCNPDLTPQVECPYCGFALQGGGLLCGKDGEVHSFTDIDGNSKTCDCSAPLGGSSPSHNCDNGFNSGATNQQGDGSDGTCIIELPDGTSATFMTGEPISSVLPNRCGSDFPCFCDPSVDSQISCPYCRFPDADGELVCARDGQVVAFQDEQGVNQMCSCTIDLDGQAQSICNPSSGGGSGRNNNNPPTSPPIVQPTDQLDVCTLEVEDSGQIITFQNGESFGEYLTTRCGTPDDFPCYCNTALPNQLDCPYCGFVTEKGDLECARNGETIDFVDGDVYRSCSCQIVTPGAEPIRSCTDGDVPPTAAPTEPLVGVPAVDIEDVCTANGENGEIVVIQDGASFADLYEGVCGSPEDWPAFCNIGLAGSISRQQGGVGDSFIEYPYCVFENTQSGDPICARTNAQITFVDDIGVTQRCSCAYLSPSLGGAQATCAPVTPSPTPAPVAAADPTSPNSSSTRHAVSSFTFLLLAGMYVTS